MEATSWLWRTLAWPVWLALVDVAGWLWRNLANVAYRLWRSVLLPVLRAMADAGAWLWRSLLLPALAWLVKASDALVLTTQAALVTLVQAGHWLWSHVLTEIALPCARSAAVLADHLSEAAVWAVSSALDAGAWVACSCRRLIGALLDWLWQLVSPLVLPLVRAVTAVAQAVAALARYVEAIFDFCQRAAWFACDACIEAALLVVRPLVRAALAVWQVLPAVWRLVGAGVHNVLVGATSCARWLYQHALVPLARTLSAIVEAVTDLAWTAGQLLHLVATQLWRTLLVPHVLEPLSNLAYWTWSRAAVILAECRAVLVQLSLTIWERVLLPLCDVAAYVGRALATLVQAVAQAGWSAVCRLGAAVWLVVRGLALVVGTMCLGVWMVVVHVMLGVWTLLASFWHAAVAVCWAAWLALYEAATALGAWSLALGYAIWSRVLETLSPVWSAACVTATVVWDSVCLAVGTLWDQVLAFGALVTHAALEASVALGAVCARVVSGVSATVNATWAACLDSIHAIAHALLPWLLL